MVMDTVLCDELLQEIFHRLPPSSSSSVSLVSKRWLRLLRSSTTALSLTCLTTPCSSLLPSFSSFLSSYPYLSSLSLSSTSSSDHLLRSIAFSCPNLCYLRFHPSDSVSLPSFLLLSVSCPRLTSLVVAISRPIVLHWLGRLRSLNELSLFINGSTEQFQPVQFNCPDDELQTELNLMSLSISGMRAGDEGLNWLWGNCKQLKRLKLTSCECVGDDSSFSAFITSLKDLQEVEFRTSRTIVDEVLLKLAENCVSLDSLLVYDGGSKQGLLQFIIRSRCKLRKLDLRLPLDLDDDHMIAISENFTSLSSLVLQSCCLVTGEGLEAVSRCLSQVLDELSLINCDAVERESGLLTTLGQNLRKLRVLDFSYNDKMNDKELTSMLVSCCNLKQLKLRGCNKLTDATVASLINCCKQLEIVDLVFCYRISAAAVESFVLKSRHLKKLHIEITKISDAATTWASSKCIQIVS